MITVNYTEVEDDLILQLSGHANYAKNGQPDIVCASVSALSYTLLNAMVHMDIKMEVKENPGDFLCGIKLTELTEERKAMFKLIFWTIMVGICGIAETHPDNVQVIFTN